MQFTIEDTDLNEMDQLIDSYNEVAKANGFETVWSMWRMDEWQDMNDVSGIPSGTVIRHHNGWGEQTSAEVKGNTWLDVWRACDKAIVESGDRHHIYIEQLIWATIEQPDGTVQKFLDMTTGS